MIHLTPREFDRAVAEALTAGRTRAMVLHPTKGYRYANLTKPRPSSGLFDWLKRCFGITHGTILLCTLFRPAMTAQLLRR